MKKILITLTICLLTLPSAWADKIIRRDGSVINTEVVKITAKEIIYRIAGSPQPMKLDLVQDLVFDKKPPLYKRAMIAFNAHAYEKAIKTLEKAIKAPKAPHWVKQYALKKIAECYMNMSKWSDAVKAYDNLIKQVPDTMFLTEAYLEKTRALIEKKDLKKAEATIKEAVSSKQSQDMPFFKQLTRLGEGRLKIAKGDFTGAFDGLKRLAKRNKKKYPGLSSQAAELAGSALLQGKKYDNAIKYYQGFIEECHPKVIANAYTGLGESLFRKAESLKGKDALDFYDEARWALLRVDVLYSHAAIVVKARYLLAQCFEKLSEKEANAKARAKNLYKYIVTKAPNSPLAKDAKARMKKIKG